MNRPTISPRHNASGPSRTGRFPRLIALVVILACSGCAAWTPAQKTRAKGVAVWLGRAAGNLALQIAAEEVRARWPKSETGFAK